jgi:hypothetical protein
VRVVHKDEAAGVEVLPGLAPVRLDRPPLQVGGVYDVLTRRWVEDRPCDPLVWYCSPEQFEIVAWAGSEPYVLMYGAEGVGKTQVLSMTGLWMMLHALPLPLHQPDLVIGVTAPTGPRLKAMMKALEQRVPIEDAAGESVPGAWGVRFKAENEVRFEFGFIWQFQTTEQRSADAGSPVQSYTWWGHLGDELQDTVEQGRDADIEARLRGAKNTWRRNSATAKDSVPWKAWRDKRNPQDWAVRRLPYTANPLEWDERWLKMARNITERERNRRLLALDVGAELGVYYNYRPERNIGPRPDIAIDVTRAILEGFGFRSYMLPGASFAMLCGHDPGKIFQTTVMLKAYLVWEYVLWVVVDEFITGPGRKESAFEVVGARQHAALLRAHLRRKWGLEGDPVKGDDLPNKALILRDPHSRGDHDENAGRQVDAAFQAQKLDILLAAQKKQVIRQADRLEMMNRLLWETSVTMEKGADGITRLVTGAGVARLLIHKGWDGAIAAPTVIEALSSLEMDERGMPEQDKKGIHDRTHPGVAVGYALFPFEEEAATEHTRALARQARARERYS